MTPNEVSAKFSAISGLKPVGVSCDETRRAPGRQNVLVSFEDMRAGRVVTALVSYMDTSDTKVINNRIADAVDEFEARVAAEGMDIEAVADVEVPDPDVKEAAKAEKS